MKKIDNYNCEGMCIEKGCSKKYTEITHVKINGMDIIFTFCKQHAGVYEAFDWVKKNPLEKQPTILCEERDDGVKGLQFFCEYCGEIHRHGIGEGHRVAHCSNPHSPYKKDGYILKEVKNDNP